ncbi:MAG TPA: electron transport complex protein RnfG [Lentisphaeria bacterium]|nr:electron transport complex protein RnfG [Lentisphaeria bacterium]
MAKPKITVCIGSSCFARGNELNVEVIQKYLEEHHLKDEVDLELQGALCQGRCADGPIVVVDDQIYTKVDRGVMLDLMKKLFPEK